MSFFIRTQPFNVLPLLLAILFFCLSLRASAAIYAFTGAVDCDYENRANRPGGAPSYQLGPFDYVHIYAPCLLNSYVSTVNDSEFHIYSNFRCSGAGSLENYGQLTVYHTGGTLINNGSFDNYGTFKVYGSLTNNDSL